MCLGLTSCTSSNLCVFIFRNRSGRYRGEKHLSEGVSHLVAIVLKTKGNRGVFIIRIMESVLLTLIFHYLEGMSVTVCYARALEMWYLSLDIEENCFF